MPTFAAAAAASATDSRGTLGVSSAIIFNPPKFGEAGSLGLRILLLNLYNTYKH
jgi:hypothetical protein